MGSELVDLGNSIFNSEWLATLVKIALAGAIGIGVIGGSGYLQKTMTREFARWLAGYLGIGLMFGAPIAAVFGGGWWWALPFATMLVIAIYMNIDYRGDAGPTTWVEVSGSYKWRSLGYKSTHQSPVIVALAEYLVHDESVANAVDAVRKGETEEAKEEFERLAADGNPAAMNNLAVMLESGLGARPSKGDAMLWYKRAADAGTPIAKHNLAVILAADHISNPSAFQSWIDPTAGVKADDKDADFIEAYVLFSQAAHAGLALAARGLKDLKKHMTVAQITVAKKRLAKDNTPPYGRR
jgi:TPR repeat protein